MTNDDRNNLIEFICNNFRNWTMVYDYVMRENKSEHPKFNGWFISSDGPNISDVYFQSEHPCSDRQGQTVTKQDCFDEYPH